MKDRQNLHSALDQALACGPFYGGGLFNHLPMALHAAWALGADSARLQAQITHDAPRLPPRPAARPRTDWRTALGHRKAWAGLHADFAARIAAHGAETVLHDTLPVLMRSPHAAAFHGLIRSAHAFEGGHAGELAAALASWAATWVEPRVPAPDARSAAPLQHLAAWCAALQAARWRGEGRLISDRADAAMASPAYTALADTLEPAADLAQRREQLLQLALDAYLASGNFTALHLLTGLRAVRVLAPLLPAQPEVQAWLTRAFVAAWLAAQLQRRPPPDAPPPDWPALHAAALAQFDDHALKLVHACWQEDQHRPDPRWRAAAALALG
ncbi:questin oxidase family protein [Pseudorhodoferax sp.]|uniref:questin oxidase family protein n=1 Tax=Pseudorhodoferax sp. TaxID=1993553 RepID=UPI002DD6653C|nr:questin oxidase family protein [Pseudorhodoferax sp.]